VYPLIDGVTRKRCVSSAGGGGAGGGGDDDETPTGGVHGEGLLRAGNPAKGPRAVRANKGICASNLKNLRAVCLTALFQLPAHGLTFFFFRDRMTTSCSHAAPLNQLFKIYAIRKRTTIYDRSSLLLCNEKLKS